MATKNGKTETAKRKQAADQVDGSGEVVTQLATRVPKTLYKQLKLHAVTNDLSIANLVTEALRDLLARKSAKKAA